MTAAIVTRGLGKRYGSRAAVEALDLRIDRGELYGLVGPNGAGKTTTIRMLVGLVAPDAGSVELLGHRVDTSVLSRVGALVEAPGFWPYLTGRRNLEMYARAGGSGADARSRLDRIDDVLTTVGLAGAAGKKVGAYSQGMRQRLGVALALSGRPELMVLDEPTNGLDPRGARELRTLLRELRDAGTTIVISSHVFPEVEAICDRVGVLAHGRLVAESDPATLARTTATIRVEVDDRAKAAAALVARARVVEGAERPGAGVLRLRMEDGTTAADVNRVLVEAGLAVSSIARDGFEEAFLALTEGDDAPG